MSFDEVVDRTDSDSSRWGGQSDRLALTIGDSDFRLPPPVESAIEQRMSGIAGYDNVPERLETAIIERLDRLYGWQIQPDWLVFLPGVVQGLNLCCRSLTAEHESVVTEVPVYYPFLDAPLNAGRKRIDLSAVLASDGWRFDHDGFEQILSTSDSRLFMLCHPHNPLGRILDHDDLARIADTCEKYDVLICSDEIHADLLFEDARHIPMANVSASAASRTVMLSSPSKAFAMSGLGGAFAIIANPEIRASFTNWSNGLVPNISVLSLAAMYAAYTECDTWLREEISYLRSNRDYLMERFKKLDRIQCLSPDATYFLWLDFRGTGWNDPYEKLLEYGVELTDGARFSGPGFLRLNFASPRSVLEEAADRIERALIEKAD